MSFFTNKNTKEIGNGQMPQGSMCLVIENTGHYSRMCYVPAVSYYEAMATAETIIPNLLRQKCTVFWLPIIMEKKDV
jgi:hypothetical protein